MSYFHVSALSCAVLSALPALLLPGAAHSGSPCLRGHSLLPAALTLRPLCSPGSMSPLRLKGLMECLSLHVLVVSCLQELSDIGEGLLL